MSRQKGDVGEEQAVEWLKGEGFEILARQFHSPWGEVDVIAASGVSLCFVEVKSRRSRSFGSVWDSISPHKRRRLKATAEWYLLHNEENCQGYDIVTIGALLIDLSQGAPRITFLQNAVEEF